MADRKISDLTALTTPASGDFLPIVDISEAAAATKNKRITIEELMRGMPDGTAAAPGIAFENDPNTGIYSPGADTLAFVEGGVEAMRIDSSGRVGIGTTSPGNLLHVSGTGTVCQLASSNNNNLINLKGNGATNGVWLGTTSSDDFLISSGASISERARIDSSGRLLVGTSTDFDSYLNQVSSTSGSLLSLRRTNSNPVSIKLSSGASGDNVGNNNQLGYLRWYGFHTSTDYEAARISAEVDGTPGAGDMPGRLVFSTTADGAASPTERMRITNGGNILINATSVVNQGLVLISYSGVSNQGAIFADSSTASGNVAILFKVAGTNVGSITTTSSSTAYNTSSDYRLKENVVPLTGAAARLNQLQVHRFNFIADPGKTVDGFIAHEAQTVVPEAVHGTKDEVDNECNPVYQGIDQSKLVPLLTAALQEAIGRIETLEARLTAAGIE